MQKVTDTSNVAIYFHRRLHKQHNQSHRGSFSVVLIKCLGISADLNNHSSQELEGSPSYAVKKRMNFCIDKGDSFQFLLKKTSMR